MYGDEGTGGQAQAGEVVKVMIHICYANSVVLLG